MRANVSVFDLLQDSRLTTCQTLARSKKCLCTKQSPHGRKFSKNAYLLLLCSLAGLDKLKFAGESNGETLFDAEETMHQLNYMHGTLGHESLRVRHATH